MAGPEATSAGEGTTVRIDRSGPDIALIARIARGKMTISRNRHSPSILCSPAQLPIELFFGCCEAGRGPDEYSGESV